MNIKNTFYPHIEGLRGLAVLLVILYHLNNSFFFGYLGVDIFFCHIWLRYNWQSYFKL